MIVNYFVEHADDPAQCRWFHQILQSWCIKYTQGVSSFYIYWSFDGIIIHKKTSFLSSAVFLYMGLLESSFISISSTHSKKCVLHTRTICFVQEQHHAYPEEMINISQPFCLWNGLWTIIYTVLQLMNATLYQWPDWFGPTPSRLAHPLLVNWKIRNFLFSLEKRFRSFWFQKTKKLTLQNLLTSPCNSENVLMHSLSSI